MENKKYYYLDLSLTKDEQTLMQKRSLNDKQALQASIGNREVIPAILYNLPSLTAGKDFARAARIEKELNKSIRYYEMRKEDFDWLMRALTCELKDLHPQLKRIVGQAVNNLNKIHKEKPDDA